MREKEIESKGRQKETVRNPCINLTQGRKTHREESNLFHNREHKYQLIIAAQYATTDLATELEARSALTSSNYRMDVMTHV
jgi:hypothetical protein